MHKISTYSSKLRVQLVGSVSKVCVVGVAQKTRQCINHVLSTFWPTHIPAAIHTKICSFISLPGVVIHAIHRAYKREKQIKRNLIVIHLSGELS